MQQPFDMAVTGGSVLLPDGSRSQLDIGVRDGVFAALLSPGSAIEATQRIDARGLLVMPGGLDVHVHLGHGKDISRPRVPEDAASETGAAAAGGLTTIVAYLMGTEPYENGLFDEVRSVTEAGARVDFGYHFIISSEEQLAGVPDYIARYGAPSFKIFMNNRGGEGSRLGLPDIDDGFLFRLAEAAAKHGGMVCPHPENIEVSWVLRDRAKAADPEGKGGLPLWNSTRPAFVEADAVQRAALLSHAAGAHLYVVHTSSAAALEAGLMHRRAGARVSLETCPHYLTHDIGWDKGDIGKINPPLRETADREALWRAVASGEIDTIASDHVHRDISSKVGGTWAASPGCPGLETLLPVLLSEGHHKRGIPLARIADLISTNPARLMGLANKGGIAIGKDADLALVDLKGSWLVERKDLRSNAGYSIYEGWRLQGKIISTLVRGAPVLHDGELIDAAVGTGRYVKRVLS